MELSAKEVATYLNGEVEGDPEAQITGFARIEQATQGALCFLANPKYEEYLYKTKATLAIVSRKFTLREPVKCTIVWVDDAYQGIATMLNIYATLNTAKKTGRSWRAHVSLSAKRGKGGYVGAFAYIGKRARIGNNVKIFPHVYIGDNVTIGDNTIIYSGARIYAGCSIGASCILHAGAVVGSDGFGFAPDAEKNYKKIPQIGNVVVEDNVEIGANACIDRATMNSTIIHSGVKLDNLVHIAHNVEVGRNTVMAALNGIAGSTKIGEGCMFGGQAGVIGHLTIGNNVMLAARAGVAQNIKDGEAHGGWPSMPIPQFNRSHVVFRKLPELYSKVLALEKELAALKAASQQ